MLNFSKRDTYFMLMSIALFSILAFLLGATNYRDSLSGVKWTHIISTLVTTLGFIFALITYNEWISSKKRDDRYSAAKAYLSTLSKIKQTIREASRQYFHVCPAEGLVLEGKEFALKRIEYTNQLREKLYLLTNEVSDLRDELYFWKINFTEEYQNKHEEIMNDLRDIQLTMYCLTSQLFPYYSKDDNRTYSGIISEKKGYDKYRNRLMKNLDIKALMSFEKVFIFE